ncbi:hypothetical protein KKF34_18275 [Myxococcota bacterium]|nr:hypothetical protein [Myxococcota bacterium]
MTFRTRNNLAKYKERLDSELAIIMSERKPGDRWLGVEKIKKVSPFSSPKTDSPLWRLKPNFLSAEKPKRIEMWKKWKYKKSTRVGDFAEKVEILP